MARVQKQGFVVDNHSAALLTIDLAHYMLHRGSYYSTPVVVASVGSGSTTWVMLKTPEGMTRECHVEFSVQSPMGGLIDFQKNITYSATTSGTAQTPVCLKLNNTGTGILQVYLNPTVSGTGTNVIEMNAIVGTAAGGANRIGSVGRQDAEVVMDAGQQHGIRFISATNQTNVIIGIEHYELEDR